MSALSNRYRVNYRIDVELKIRKILEEKTSYLYEFQKNETDTQDDIVVYKYNVRENSHDKLLIGYIEIEVSLDKWVNEYPKYWKEISYLKRKIFKFDWNQKVFLLDSIDNIDRCMYVKFNSTITDCHFNTKDFIIKNYKDSSRNGNLKDLRIYNDSYLSIQYKGRENHNNFGIENFIDKTIHWLNSKDGIKVNTKLN